MDLRPLASATGDAKLPSAGTELPRRGFLYKAAAVIFGGITAVVPALAGCLFFLDPLEELVRRQIQQGPVGGIRNHLIDAARRQQLGLALQRAQRRRGLVGPQNRNGMGIEREDHGRDGGRPGKPDQLGNHRLMAPMHPIEVADRNKPSAIGRGIAETVEELHEGAEPSVFW